MAAAAAPASAEGATSQQLHSAIAELSALLLSGAPTVLTAFDAAAQEHLARNDELLAQVDSARLEIQHTTDVAFANLLTQTQVRGEPCAARPRPRRRPPHAPLLPVHAHAPLARSCWRCTQ